MTRGSCRGQRVSATGGRTDPDISQDIAPRPKTATSRASSRKPCSICSSGSGSVSRLTTVTTHVDKLLRIGERELVADLDFDLLEPLLCTRQQQRYSTIADLARPGLARAATKERLWTRKIERMASHRLARVRQPANRAPRGPTDHCESNLERGSRVIGCEDADHTARAFSSSVDVRRAPQASV